MESGAKGFIAAHSSGQGNDATSSFRGSLQGFRNEDVNDGFLKGSANVRDPHVYIFDLWKGISDCGLKSGKGKVEFSWHGAWKFIRIRVP
tara:strand:- start:86 stop:355 length:270 start_codon:yes stop_codon:yes gene_type:complete